MPSSCSAAEASEVSLHRQARGGEGQAGGGMAGRGGQGGERRCQGGDTWRSQLSCSDLRPTPAWPNQTAECPSGLSAWMARSYVCLTVASRSPKLDECKVALGGALAGDNGGLARHLADAQRHQGLQVGVLCVVSRRGG